jgi:hypothetical protein
MNWFRKLLTVPIDYEKGFEDGFVEGIKFSKWSYDELHKAVLQPHIVKRTLQENRKKRRKETESGEGKK